MTRRRSGPRPAWSWLITFVVSAGLWLVLAGSLARSELLAGAAVAALAATASVLARGAAPTTRPAAATLGAVARALATVPADHVRLLRHLGRELRGRPSQGRFEVGPGRGAVDPVVASLSPNRYAIAAEDETGRMLVHELDGPRAGDAR